MKRRNKVQGPGGGGGSTTAPGTCKVRDLRMWLSFRILCVPSDRQHHVLFWTWFTVSLFINDSATWSCHSQIRSITVITAEIASPPRVTYCYIARIHSFITVLETIVTGYVTLGKQSNWNSKGASNMNKHCRWSQLSVMSFAIVGSSVWWVNLGVIIFLVAIIRSSRGMERLTV
jgi:hypothetical protein